MKCCLLHRLEVAKAVANVHAGRGRLCVVPSAQLYFERARLLAGHNWQSMSVAECSATYCHKQQDSPVVAEQATLCVEAPAAMVAYIWNQWLKMSSMSSARKPQYHWRFSMPRMASSPAVDSLPPQMCTAQLHTAPGGEQVDTLRQLRSQNQTQLSRRAEQVSVPTLSTYWTMVGPHACF